MIKLLFDEFEQHNFIPSLMKGEGICKINIDDYKVKAPFTMTVNLDDSSPKSIKFNNGIHSYLEFKFENDYDAEKVMNTLINSNNEALQLFHYWSEEFYRFRIINIHKSRFISSSITVHTVIGSKIKTPDVSDLFTNKVSIEDINSIKSESTKRYFVRAILHKGILEFPSGQVKVGSGELDTDLADLPTLKLRQYAADDHNYVEIGLSLFDHDTINPRSIKVSINNVKIPEKWISCGMFTYLDTSEEIFVTRIAIPIKNKKIDTRSVKQILIDFSKIRKN